MHMLSPPVPQVPSRPLPESDDPYPAVARLNARWRVVVCRDGIQWILQRRHGLGDPESSVRTVWNGRGRSKTALLRCWREHAGPIEPAAAAVLATLPNWVEGNR